LHHNSDGAQRTPVASSEKEEWPRGVYGGKGSATGNYLEGESFLEEAYHALKGGGTKGKSRPGMLRGHL